MILKILLIIFLISLFISLLGAFDGVLAFFLLVFSAFGFVTWYYYDDFGFMQ